jgi:hypothetical protein
MRPEDVSDWVPPAVKSMAAVMPIGAAISQRLLTDPRMKRVWSYLQRLKVTAATIDALPPSLRMETWEICLFPASKTLDEGVLLQDRACAVMADSYHVHVKSQHATAAILILTYGGLASGLSKARVAMSCCQEGKTT